MSCPWCEFTGGPRALQGHLTEDHPEGVTFGQRANGTRFYEITCPICDVSYDQRIKPRSQDAGFLEEFQREIRLVAFDMMVNHLVAEHYAAAAGGKP
jgi:hypothetical protein